MKNLLLLGIGLVLALIAKATGRFAATVHHVDPTGSRWTIEQHLGRITRLFGGAIAIAVTVVAVFLVPAGWAKWAVPLGLLALVLGNLCLGGLSGTSESLGRFLGRWSRWIEIERLVAMKKHTRALLTRFFLALLVVAVSAAMACPAQATGACAIVLDPTVSVDRAGREIAIAFLECTIFDYIANARCSSIAVVTMGREPRFAGRVILQVPAGGPDTDCADTTPVPLVGEAALFGWSKNVAEATRQEGIDRCLRSQSERKRQYLAAQAQFLRALHDALYIEPTFDYSRITETVEYLSQDAVYSSIVFVTDLLDNPPVSLNGIAIPEGVSVVLIAVQPNRKYGSARDVIARAREWERIPRVTVVTVNELRPELWSWLRMRK